VNPRPGRPAPVPGIVPGNASSASSPPVDLISGLRPSRVPPVLPPSRPPSRSEIQPIPEENQGVNPSRAVCRPGRNPGRENPCEFAHFQAVPAVPAPLPTGGVKGRDGGPPALRAADPPDGSEPIPSRGRPGLTLESLAAWERSKRDSGGGPVRGSRGRRRS
jgi:hypothetical protein